MFFIDKKASENGEKKITYRPVSSTPVKIALPLEKVVLLMSVMIQSD